MGASRSSVLQAEGTVGRVRQTERRAGCGFLGREKASWGRVRVVVRLDRWRVVAVMVVEVVGLILGKSTRVLRMNGRELLSGWRLHVGKA